MASRDLEQEAVLADLAPRLLVTAPPGSGKTFTAVRLVARDIASGIIGPTQQTLVLTFSLQARRQIESYARTALADAEPARAEITNYHRWFWSKIRAFRSSLGLPDQLDVSTTVQHREDVEAAMLATGLSTRSVEDQWQDYARAHEFSVPGARPARLPEALDRGEEVAEQLLARHRAMGRIHYDDMAFYAWRLIDRSATLRRIWAHKYPVVVLDEYQDAAPLQAMIVERLADDGSRMYAFADPLQMIYGFRDASPQRLDEFAAKHASTHDLRTLHRYSDTPALQRWMEGVRDVLLNDAQTCPPLPPEVEVIRYAADSDNKVRGEPYDTHSRHLWVLDDPISQALGDSSLRTVAVTLRKHSHFARVEARLCQRFYPRHIRTAEDTAEWARDWLEAYATAAASRELRAGHLVQIASRVAPRNEDLADLATRVSSEGIKAARLRGAKRELAENINTLLDDYDSMTGALRAAVRVAALAEAHEDPRRVASDAVFVVRRAFAVRSGLDEAEAHQRALGRLASLRFTTEDDARRGLYLLTCHQGKGKEFDVVVVPYLSDVIFPNTAESRQLLYVTLTRARKRLIVRSAANAVPAFARTIGLG